MSVIYNTTVKNNRMTQVLNALDAGSGAAVLKIGTAGMATELVSITLADPSGTVAAGALTFSGMPKSGTAVATGAAAAAQLLDSNATVVVDGLTVGTTGTNIVLDTATISAIGQTVNITAASITHG